MITILRGADAEQSLIDAVKNFKCDSCDNIGTPGIDPLVKQPSRFMFKQRSVTQYLRDTWRRTEEVRMAGKSMQWFEWGKTGPPTHI